MKTLKQFISWLHQKPKKADETYNGYTPSKDVSKILERQKALEAYRKGREAAKKKLSQMPQYKSSSITIGNQPSYSYTSITTQDQFDSRVIKIGPSEIKSDVPLIVQNRNVLAELDEMRDALLLLKRDVNMEEKYPRLKELKDEYEATLAKYKTFETIKNSK